MVVTGWSSYRVTVPQECPDIEICLAPSEAIGCGSKRAGPYDLAGRSCMRAMEVFGIAGLLDANGRHYRERLPRARRGYPLRRQVLEKGRPPPGVAGRIHTDGLEDLGVLAETDLLEPRHREPAPPLYRFSS